MNANEHRTSAAFGLAQSLAAVRRALLEDARAEAEQIEAEARRVADDVRRGSIEETDAEVERERHRSELAAQAYANTVLARARNAARAEVLRKQEELRRQLGARVRAAALEIRCDERYPSLLERLDALAVGQLGDAAIIMHDRGPEGGAIATCGTRRVDYTLVALADRALDAISDEAVQLWT